MTSRRVSPVAFVVETAGERTGPAGCTGPCPENEPPFEVEVGAYDDRLPIPSLLGPARVRRETNGKRADGRRVRLRSPERLAAFHA